MNACNDRGIREGYRGMPSIGKAMAEKVREYSGENRGIEEPISEVQKNLYEYWKRPQIDALEGSFRPRGYGKREVNGEI